MEEEEERTDLDSLGLAASLLAHDVDQKVSEAYLSIQKQSGSEVQNRQPAGPIKTVPPMIQSLTLVDRAGTQNIYYKRESDGSWERSDRPAFFIGREEELSSVLPGCCPASS